MLNKRPCLLLLGLLLQACLAAGAGAQTPVVSGGPPSESFVGEQFCYNLSLTNSSVSDTGFGPYVRLALDPGLSFASASLVPMLPAQVVTDTFPGVAPLEVIDPVIGDAFPGPADGEFVSITLPIGSVIPAVRLLVSKSAPTLIPRRPLVRPWRLPPSPLLSLAMSMLGAARRRF